MLTTLVTAMDGSDGDNGKGREGELTNTHYSGGKIFGSCNCPGWKDDGDPLDDTAHRLNGNVDKRWIYPSLNKALIAIEKYVKVHFIRNLSLF